MVFVGIFGRDRANPITEFKALRVAQAQARADAARNLDELKRTMQ